MQWADAEGGFGWDVSEEADDPCAKAFSSYPTPEQRAVHEFTLPQPHRSKDSSGGSGFLVRLEDTDTETATVMISVMTLHRAIGVYQVQLKRFGNFAVECRLSCLWAAC